MTERVVPTLSNRDGKTSPSGAHTGGLGSRIKRTVTNWIVRLGESGTVSDVAVFRFPPF